MDRLRSVPLFAGLGAEDLARICENVTEVHLGAGDLLFAEGQTGGHAYVIASGELEVLKKSERRETLLALRVSGDVIGEMALLREEPRMASVRARSDSELLAIPKAALDELLDTSPSAGRAMFTTLLDRWQETNDQLRHNERMAQLGTLTAGVAHELNNPAAAVKRSAGLLADAIQEFRVAIAAEDFAADDVKAIGEVAAASRAVELSAMERTDREDEIEIWLDERGIAEPWKCAPVVVDAGVGSEALAAMENEIGSDKMAAAVDLLVATSTVHRLVSDIGEGASRLSDIVGALKGYSYLDQAPVQEVDVIKGIEDTVLLLGHKLRGVDVRRDFAEGVPTITAFGSELNQVWTNLLDNAADAVEGSDAPMISLRAWGEEDELVIEVEDNGDGIPEDIQDQIFDSFFTTKAPGKGTGLGLQITHRIVVLDHRGAISVDSEPGRTTFHVRLPIDQPDVTDNTDQRGQQ